MQAKRDLFTIGEFSKLTGMGIHSLRYYDEIGALKPEYVDPVSNYRYYGFDQLRKIPGIRMCTESGIKLSDFTDFVENGRIDYKRLIEDSKAALDARINEFIRQKEELDRAQKTLSLIDSAEDNDFITVYFEGGEIWTMPLADESITDNGIDILVILSSHASRRGYQISPVCFGLIQTETESGTERFAFASLEDSPVEKTSPFAMHIAPGKYLLQRCSMCSLRTAEKLLHEDRDTDRSVLISFTLLGDNAGECLHFSAVRICES